MAVYDYATQFTQLLDQKYAKELCSDALSQSNPQVKFLNAQTIKLPRITVSGYKDHTRTLGFNAGTLSNDWEPKKLAHDRDIEFWIDPMDINEIKRADLPLKYRGYQLFFLAVELKWYYFIQLVNKLHLFIRIQMAVSV